MTFLVEEQQLLGTLVLFVDHLQHLVVHNLGRGLGVGLLEVVFLVVVVADVGQLVAHAGVGNHRVDGLSDALQVVHGTCGDMSGEEFLGSTSAQERADFVEHLFLGRNLTLFGHIPGCAEGTAAGHDGDLDQRVCMLAEP